jgi:hypothetical protein
MFIRKKLLRYKCGQRGNVDIVACNPIYIHFTLRCCQSNLPWHSCNKSYHQISLKRRTGCEKLGINNGILN